MNSYAVHTWQYIIHLQFILKRIFLNFYQPVFVKNVTKCGVTLFFCIPKQTRQAAIAVNPMGTLDLMS